MNARLFLTLGLAALCAIVLADDGWVGNGGTPSVLGGKHPTIRMADEVVKIHVGKETTTVDCVFHFVNDGPATTVRMGFPDEDSNREDGDSSVFKKYESWVDGKLVKCKFEGTPENGYWQTKSVKFGAKQARTIRDRYTVRTGAGYQGGKSYLHYADYVLHTGNTWKGTISSVEVLVDFDRNFFRPSKIASCDELNEKIHPKDGYVDEEFANKVDVVVKRNQRTLFWSGPGIPTLKNGVLRFFAKNLKPSKDDDIFLMFAPFKPS